MVSEGQIPFDLAPGKFFVPGSGATRFPALCAGCGPAERCRCISRRPGAGKCQTNPIRPGRSHHGERGDECKWDWRKELGIMLCGLWVSVVNSGAGRRREIQSTRLEARNKLEREMIETHEKRKTKPIFRQEGCYWDLGLPIGDSGQRGRQTNPISAVLAGKRGPRWKTNPIGRNERSAGTARPTGWSPKHGEACGWGLPIRSSGGTGCQTKPICGVLGGKTGMGRENKANLRIRVQERNAKRNYGQGKASHRGSRRSRPKRRGTGH